MKLSSRIYVLTTFSLFFKQTAVTTGVQIGYCIFLCPLLQCQIHCNPPFILRNTKPISSLITTYPPGLHSLRYILKESHHILSSDLSTCNLLFFLPICSQFDMLPRTHVALATCRCRGSVNPFLSPPFSCPCMSPTRYRYMSRAV